MKLLVLASRCLFALIILHGCASTTVVKRDQYTGERIARPDQIIVYDFGVTPSDVPPQSALVGLSSNQTAEQIETGRKLGAELAKELVAAIRGMGLPAVEAAGGVTPRLGDLVIRGYFVSIDKGSAGERVLVGFGKGDAELKTMVEGYLVTEQGLRRLGSGEVEAGGGKTPGVLLGAATFAATSNPVGLIVGGVAKVAGEESGSSTTEGDAKHTAKEIADQLKIKFQEQGWI